MGAAHCEAGANVWIAHVFKDCIYNHRDYIGFVFGLASLITWMIAQFPQIYSNYKNKSAEALSVWFLGEWLLGDTCNLIGCLLTGNQLVTQIYTAMYFVCADVMLCVQYVYYNTIRHSRLRAQRSGRYRLQSRPHDESFRSNSGNTFEHSSPTHASSTKMRALACFAFIGLGSQISFPSAPGHLEANGRILMADTLYSKHDADWRQAVGQTIGWVSSVLYLGSRLSQIYKNWHRQSADGLSLAMFICAISANLLYGFGILFRTYRIEDLLSSGPWLLGSLGTVVLDIIIFSQFQIYKDAEKRRSSDDFESALLEEDLP